MLESLTVILDVKLPNGSLTVFENHVNNRQPDGHSIASSDLQLIDLSSESYKSNVIDLMAAGCPVAQLSVVNGCLC